MKTQEKTQSDLFEQGHAVDKKIRRKARFLLPDIRSNLTLPYETVIFLMIGFVMVSIIIFSLGVEKGRYDEKKKQVMIRQQLIREVQAEAPKQVAQPQPKPELKKGVSNVATSKPKNIKSR